MDSDHSQFSEREKEVISLLLQGKSNKQIALALNISQSTVEYHLKNIYHKLEVNSRTEAVLRLGKSIGHVTPNGLRESTGQVYGKPTPMRRISINKMYAMIIGLLLTVLLVGLRIFVNPTSTEWQDQIVYSLSPQKFYDGDPNNNYMRDRYQLPNPGFQGGFLGGDIAGISEKMEYIKGLGVTSVLLGSVLSNSINPIFQYLPTGNSIRDFHTVDQNFGTNQDLIQLIAAFHSRWNGPINVILDLPMAWTGIEHPWYINSESYPWYYRPWNADDPSDNIATEPIPVSYGMIDHWPGSPLINHTQGMDNDTGVYREVRDNIVFWLVDHFDLDGFRYQAAGYFHAAFWPKLMRDFHEEYDKTKSHFWHIADVAVVRGTEKSWQVPYDEFINQTSSVGEIRMDGVHDFTLSAWIQEVFVKGTDPNCLPLFCDSLLTHLVDPYNIQHPEWLTASVDFLDTSFIAAAPDDTEKNRLYLASVFLFTINRVPLINSGNEYGIDDSQPGALFADDVDESFHENYKKLIQIRRDHAAFRRGSLIPLTASDTITIITYARRYEGQTFIVILNNAESSQPFKIDLGSNEISCNNPENLLPENDRTIQPNDTSLSGTLDAWGAKIIQCK